MNFTTNCIEQCAPRIGTLSGFKRFPETKFATPLLLMYTRRGSIPHLTKEVQRMANINQQLLSISIPSIISMGEVVKQFNSFVEFVNMKDHLTFLTIQDPTVETKKGFQQTDSVPVWSRHGRHSLTADKFMDFIEVMKPDMYLALCDGDTDDTSTAKRASRAVRRSEQLLERCVERHNTSEILKGSGILGAVEGGYEISQRDSCIKYLKKQDLLGFVIDGLHRNGPLVANIKFDKIKEIVQHTITNLPKEKLRVSMGSWSPVTVLDLIGLGVDVFDSSYAYLLTEQGKAFTFSCDGNLKQEEPPEISLFEEKYADDFSPLVAECDCLACQNHTKAYIHHLCVTKELLAQVLLMIHNTHHYIKFFNAIQTNLANETFPNFEKNIRNKYLSHIENS